MKLISFVGFVYHNDVGNYRSFAGHLVVEVRGIEQSAGPGMVMPSGLVYFSPEEISLITNEWKQGKVVIAVDGSPLRFYSVRNPEYGKIGRFKYRYPLFDFGIELYSSQLLFSRYSPD